MAWRAALRSARRDLHLHWFGNRDNPYSLQHPRLRLCERCTASACWPRPHGFVSVRCLTVLLFTAHLNRKILRNSLSIYLCVVQSGHALVHFFVAALFLLRVGLKRWMAKHSNFGT
jgi:hypothetical protein